MQACFVCVSVNVGGVFVFPLLFWAVWEAWPGLRGSFREAYSLAEGSPYKIEPFGAFFCTTRACVSAASLKRSAMAGSCNVAFRGSVFESRGPLV